MPKNRPQKIKMIMKNRFFKIDLETFLGHLDGVGWSPGCEKHVFWLVLDASTEFRVDFQGLCPMFENHQNFLIDLDC